MKITIDDINIAFTPKREITDPKQFVGRYKEIKQSVKFLNTYGAFLTIYGLRGLGKSSLANQIKLIAEGNNILLKLCSLDKFIPKKGFNYIVHLIRCDHSVKDIATLVKRIVLGDEKNPSLYKHIKNTDLKIEKALKVFADKSDLKENRNDTFLSNDIIQIFRQSLSVIRKDNQDKTGILILIDEFDIIANKNNFSSIIKSLSDVDFVKFGIIGIADDISDLLHEHASIARQIEAVEVGLMNNKELDQIIERAEKILKNEIIFDYDARQKIINKANGFPHYVHLLGKEALELAFEKNINNIDNDLIIECENNIKKGTSNSIHSENYQLLCSSEIRELILRLIAKDTENYVRIEKLYEELKLFGFDKPSKYFDELIDKNNSKSPIKLAKKNKFCRFSDPLFKLYINLTEPIFNENKKRIL